MVGFDLRRRRRPWEPRRRMRRHKRKRRSLDTSMKGLMMMLLLAPTGAFIGLVSTQSATGYLYAQKLGGIGTGGYLDYYRHGSDPSLSASSHPSPESSSASKDATSPSSSSFQQLRIAFVTGNAMKAREVNTILEEHGATRGPTPDVPSLVKLQVLAVDLPEIQEVDTMAIAKSKVLLGSQLAGGPCVVEDTSLQFSALGGMPGPYIKWFQDKLKSEGLYNILLAYEDKSATAVCTLAFCPAPHADPVLFTGTCRGRIVEPDRDKRYGFGWDSIFVADGSDVPFSQLSIEQKNRLSHRGKAVRKWADWLGQNKDALYERQESGAPMLGHKGLNFRSQYSEQ